MLVFIIKKIFKIQVTCKYSIHLDLFLVKGLPFEKFYGRIFTIFFSLIPQ